MMRCRPGIQEAGAGVMGPGSAGAPLKKRCTASGTREAGDATRPQPYFPACPAIFSIRRCNTAQ